MGTWVRLSDEHMKRLSFLANRLGKSESQIVEDAIDRLYEEESRCSKRSMLDRLTENNFEALDLSDVVDASDAPTQKSILREVISRKVVSHGQTGLFR